MARRNKFDPDQELDPDQLEERLEEEGNDGILRDGQSLRVPLYLRDGAINPRLTATQRGKAAQQPLVSDGSSNPIAMHRPGFRYLTDANRRAISDAAKAKAYQEVETADANAWKGAARNHDAGEFNKAAPVGAYPLSAGEGSTCTANGQDGVLVRQGNWLVCKPRRATDAAAFDAKAQAYADYDREMATAYLRGK